MYTITLDRVGSIPEGMVGVHGDSSTGPFLIDRCEVTNGQYREFMLAGGYANPSYWKEVFLENGRRISWNDAMKRFVDATSRPGPATWRAGDYIPASNFSDRGVPPVGTGEFFGPNGIRDLAGNVREWCWNENVKGRCLRGDVLT
jgi:formylglycine-generating enzyme required for sulfatase activity